MLHLISHIIGTDNGSGFFYLFWSGFVGAIEGLSIFGGVYVLYKRHQCHDPSCKRIGLRPIGDSGIVLCHKHHPEGQITREHIDKAWQHHKEKHEHGDREAN